MNSTAPLMVPVGTPRRVFVIAAVLGGVGLLIASVLGHVVVGLLLLCGPCARRRATTSSPCDRS